MELKNIVLEYFTQNQTSTNTIENIANELNLSLIDVTNIINKLESERLIYHNVKKDTYGIIRPDFFIAKVRKTKANKLYINYNNDTYSINKKHDFVLYGDTLICSINDDNELKIRQIIHRASFVCTVQVLNGKKILQPFQRTNFPFYVADEELVNYVSGDRLLIRGDIISKNGFYESHVESKICNEKDMNSSELSICAVHELYTGFTEETLNEASRLRITNDDFNNRVDLTNDCIITVDGIDTKDRDDAIDYKINNDGTSTLRVHIADVAHFVTEKSPINEDAGKKTTSVYFAGSVSPMLPHSLSSGICSLDAYEKRLAVTTEMTFDENGNIIDYKFYESVIESKKAMVYEHINDYVKYNNIHESYYPYLDTLNEMLEFSDKLSDKKNERRVINILADELYIDFDNDKNISSIANRKIGPGNKLIENFMLVANETRAAHCAKYNLPFLYRNHAHIESHKFEFMLTKLHSLTGLKGLSSLKKPSDLSYFLDSLDDSETSLIASRIILTNLAKAEYNTKNIGHYALDYESYSHFTSPIRRYADLLNHRAFKDYMKYKNPEDIPDAIKKKHYNEMVNFTNIINEKERAADLAEIDDLNLKYLNFKPLDKNTPVDMTILDIKRGYVLVRIKNAPEGIIKFDDFPDDVLVDFNSNKIYPKRGKNHNVCYKAGDKIQGIPYSVENYRILYKCITSLNTASKGYNNKKAYVRMRR